MIASPAIAPRADFEALLDKTTQALITTIETAPSMSNREFEDSVFRAMKSQSKGTAFEGKIKQTGEMDFPDITAQQYYGVEVKKTTKDTFKTSGNSIFEQTRVEGVKVVYILMANSETVRWLPYEKALDNIVVTHSPRYAINFDATETVFDKMGIAYNDFISLNQTAQMEKIKSLYEDRALWWLSQSEDINYRRWENIPQEEKEDFICEAMILCPEMFGQNHLIKFKNASVYLLGRGVISKNVRDIFTAGGKVEIGGQRYPKILGKLHSMSGNIKHKFDAMDTETLASFWPVDVMVNIDERWEQWLNMVKAESKVDVSEFFS